MKEKLIELLKLLKIYPSSGYGEINIKIENDKIILCETKEKKKLGE